MSFSYPSLARVTPFDELISFASSKPNRGAPYGKRQLRIGAAIVVKAGWKEGERIIVGFGEPGTEHAGWLRAERSAEGILIKPRNKKTKSCVISFTHVAAWISQDEHGADRCPEWRIVDGAIEIKLPGWAVKPHTAERGDHPHAGKPKTGEPDNDSLAKAGGGESSGSTDAPPAEISDPREESREGLLPPTGASIEPVPGKAPERTAARNSSSGPGEANGTTLKGEMAGHTGGEEEAATVAPPVREPDDGLTDKQRAVYAELLRAAGAGEETPRLIDLARVVGSEDPNAASYPLAVLFKMGLVRREGRHADVTYHVVAIGKSTVPRALRRATPAVKPVEKPAPARAGTVTMKFVVDWLNEMGMTCADTGGGMYVMGERYVEAQNVIDRANRKRRLRHEPDFTVA